MILVDPAQRRAVGAAPAGSPLACRVTAAADVALAAGDGATATVVIGTGPVPEERIRQLMSGPHSIGAILADRAPEYSNRRPALRDAGPDDLSTIVPASGPPAVAVAARHVAAAGLDPTVDDPGQVISALLQASSARGGRIVVDPAWSPGGGPPVGPGRPARPSASTHPTGSAEPMDVVVVTAPPLCPEQRSDDRAVDELIASLAGLSGCRVSVMTTERASVADRSRWAAAGLEVFEGPEMWLDRSTLYGRFSHAVVTSSGAGSAAREWVERTQPQATRVAYLPSLAFRQVSSLVPISPPDEMDGLHLVRLDVEDTVASFANWAGAVWCQWRADAEVLRGWAPGVAVHELPPSLRPRPGRELAGRSGVVIVAGEGHDVIGGHEDAALRALDEVVPLVAARDRSVAVTVLADRPTPMLVAACERSGASLRPEAEMAKVLSASRVLLAAHCFGSGQSAVVMAAIEHSTPFACTAAALGDLDAGPLAGTAVCDSAAGLAARVWKLLSDDESWLRAATDLAGVRDGAFAPHHRAAAVDRALADLGITPGGAPRWPAVADRPAPAVVRRPPKVALRPAGTAAAEALPDVLPTDERGRYQLWHRLYGPTPATLEALSADLYRLRHRPTFSILMPVYNTDPDVLSAAVESVRAQIYPHWQLCMANDGSHRPETIKALNSLRGDPRITIVDRPGSSGISDATNAALAVADGEYVTFLDHDDELKPHALAQVARWLDADPDLDVVYSDEDKLDTDGSLYDPHIKPDWSPDQLTTQNYVCHLLVARRSLVEKIGGLRREFDGSQDFDLILRLGEETDRIAHIPEPLYSWRAVPGSAAAVADAKPYAIEAGRRAVADALRRRGYGETVDETGRIGFYRARYPIPGAPKVSIIVPTKDGRQLLERCLDSVISRSTYPNYEIVIIDNQSTDGSALEYMAKGPWRVIRYPHRFNYARMMNLAARSVECDALLFLNNDTEIITPEWIEALLEHAMRPEVGAVGGRLYFGDGAPQHEGIMIGIGGWAHNTNHYGYWGRGDMTRNVSAVTGACTMIRPSVYWRVGGNDERLRVAYNDVDICLRIRQAGYEVVYTPYAELFHHESSTRGKFEHHEDGPLFGVRWRIKEGIDPYYSPMFEDFPPFLIRLSPPR